MGSKNNERLEFLGDSILSFVITSELYQRFQEASEGELSRYRASLVKGETLAAIARNFNLGDHIHLGPGELKSGGFRRDSILANALEAIIGAIYLDGGLEMAAKFILSIFEERLDAISTAASFKDPKTQLQEFLQSRKLPLPEYTVLTIEGHAHDQSFKVACRVAELDDATKGEGSSRRKAEQAAAKKALQLLTHDK